MAQCFCEQQLTIINLKISGVLENHQQTTHINFFQNLLLPCVILYISFIFSHQPWCLKNVFLDYSAPRNQMRSQQRRLKERRHFHFDLLQNQLIAVGCGANSVSKAAGMVPSTGGCPLARVNGSGVGGKELRRGPEEQNKELFSLDFSKWSRVKKQGSKPQWHPNLACACNFVCVCVYVGGWMGVHVIHSVRLTSCLISTQNHRQRSSFDLFTAQNCCSTLGWLVYTQTHANTHIQKLIQRRTLTQNRKMKVIQLWAESTPNLLFVILANCTV